MTAPPSLVAPVWGAGAAALVPALDQRLAVLERLSALGRINPAEVTQARQMFDLIRRAGREYVAGAAGGSAEVVSAEVPRRSSQEVSSDDVASVLGVTARRVRQLLSSELLTGRKAGRVWLVERASVETYRDLRGI